MGNEKRCQGCPVRQEIGCPAVYLPHGRFCELAASVQKEHAGYRDFIVAWAERDRVDPDAGRKVEMDEGKRPPTAPYRSFDEWVAPIKTWANGDQIDPGEIRRYEGFAKKKPWEYRTTAVVLTFETPEEQLRVVLDLLRYQSEKPYLMIVDTGSSRANVSAIERIADETEDIEAHFVRSRGWIASSAPCAAAMDVAFALCQTPYLFATHDDVFLMRRRFVQEIREQCDEATPAVGYQMSPREFWEQENVAFKELWKSTLSHTSTVYHMPSMRKYGAFWSMPAAFEKLGLPIEQPKYGFPDTEVNLGLCLNAAGVGVRFLGDPAPDVLSGEKPSVLMLGEELNDIQKTANWVHVRSSTSQRIYNPISFRDHRSERLQSEIEEGRSRADLWRKIDERLVGDRGCGCGQGLA